MDPTTSPDFLRTLGSMGIGGLIAVFAIWLLNKAWKEHAETIKGFHDTERGRTEMLVNVVKDIHGSIVKNTVVTESFHRRLDKDARERGE